MKFGVSLISFSNPSGQMIIFSPQKNFYAPGWREVDLGNRKKKSPLQAAKHIELGFIVPSPL